MDNQGILRQLLKFIIKDSLNSQFRSEIADDFEYIGGEMKNTQPVSGKQAYIDIIKRFSQRFTGMSVKQIIVKMIKAAL